jgi:hypothetical protein
MAIQMGGSYVGNRTEYAWEDKLWAIGEFGRQSLNAFNVYNTQRRSFGGLNDSGKALCGAGRQDTMQPSVSGFGFGSLVCGVLNIKL